MCTAVSLLAGDHYFGRNLDWTAPLNEAVTVTPRNYPFSFRCVQALPAHYAIIGMAVAAGGYPLYFDATNEKGLSMAGLNFPGFAVYHPPLSGKENIAPFELIPWVLGQFSTVREAARALERVSIADIPFSSQIPLTPLHWLLSDGENSCALEPLAEGLKIHDDPMGVLTNSPPFDYHSCHLTQFMQVSRHPPLNLFSGTLELEPYSYGMGGIGLPGDCSSASRFVRAAFSRLNSRSSDSESARVSQFFHILGNTAQVRGLNRVKDNDYEFTQYSSCCNTDRGVYYYTTYENSRITGIDLHKEDLNGTVPVSYPLLRDTQFNMGN